MYYGNIKDNDIANGEGVRVTLFVSGCKHHCKNCFQPETWAFDYGEPFTKDVADSIIEMLKPSWIDGLTFLGGEPFEPENQPEVLNLILRVRKELPDKTIWCYTGYTYDVDLMSGGKVYTKCTDDILKNIDILVDGEFIEAQKDIRLKFRGSRNQRLIHLSNGKVTLME